jgi:hypothetical protein
MQVPVFLMVGICFLSCNGPIKVVPVVRVDSVTIENATTAEKKYPMTDSLKNEVADEIKNFILTGFYNSEETSDAIGDMFYNETLDKAWISAEAQKAYEHRLAEQSGWPAETDFDRLVKAFDELNTSGIIALHNAGNTSSDSHEDCEDVCDELKTKGKTVKAFCFYHSQDVDGAIATGQLFIGFSAFGGDNAVTVETGKLIMKALIRQGLQPHWNNSPDTRIDIPHFKWQKRFGNDNCNREKAVRLLSKG